MSLNRHSQVHAWFQTQTLPACSIGLAANADGQVLDTEDRAIEGLYACRNDMGSIMDGAYPGPGTTLGPAMVFGYRAAMHAAQG